MAKAKAKKARGLDKADPRFFPVVKAFARTPGVSLMESQSGETRGLRLHGKSFGMSTYGRYVLKLTEERVAALISKGVGQPFRPSAGQVMKGWIEITQPTADWVALAKEAQRLAAAGKPARRKPRR